MITTTKTRDKYGRTVTHFRRDGRTICVLVSLPKPCANRFMVTGWQNQGTTEYMKRADAVRAAEAMAAAA